MEKYTNEIIQFIETFTTQVSSWKVKTSILHFMLFKTQSYEYFKTFTTVLPRAWLLFRSPSLSTVFFHLWTTACTPNPAGQSLSLFSVATGTGILQWLIIHVMMSLQAVFERTQEVNISAWGEDSTVNVRILYMLLLWCSQWLHVCVCQALSWKWTLPTSFFWNKLNP